MIQANLVFKNDIKEYEVKRLDKLINSPAGIQSKQTSTIKIKFAIYDKGTKLVRNAKEDSYSLATIHIYSDLSQLKILDEVPFNDKVYVILEEKNKFDFSFYRATSNV